MARVLVPVAVLDGESVSTGLVDLLATVDVTVLGYHELPEQTPADQARHQFEERATDALEGLVAELRAAGAAADADGTDADGADADHGAGDERGDRRVDHRLVFTHDREKTIDRLADDVHADAFVIPGMTGPVERLLVPCSGDVELDRIAAFVETLVGDREIGVTLFVAGDDADESALDPAAERLRDAGIDVRTRVGDGKPFDALIEAVPGHDAVVMGERAPSLRSFLLGEEAERVAEASVGPVLVVRGEDDAD